VGKPNERERDLIIMLQESTKQQQIYISSQGKYLTAPNLSHRNLPRFLCQNRVIVRPLLPRFSSPQSVVQTILYAQKQRTENKKPPRNQCPKFLYFRAKSVRLYGIVRTVRIRTVRPPTVEKYFGQKFTEKVSQESCPLCCSLSSQACSKNLSNSPLDVLSTSSRCLQHVLHTTQCILL
jgi:hypothetical protein